MVRVMKVKRFIIKRVPVAVEYARPIAGRLYLPFYFMKLIRHIKVQPTINDVPACKPIHLIYIPKIESSDSE